MSAYIQQVATYAASAGCGLCAATIISFAFGVVDAEAGLATVKRWLA